MISLARHIELLLLDHDCVIVPGLGGFISNHATAQFENGVAGQFLPPFRKIGFNEQLQVNDGLLIQSYMAAYDASYPSAYLQMEKEIEQLVNQLDTTGEYELEGIGKLTKSINKSISFTSSESGILTPSLYGLYSFEIKSLAEILKEEEIKQSLKAVTPTLTVDNDTKKETERETKDVVIRLRRRWIDFSVSAAAAVLLFFCFSYPALNTNNPEGDTCVASVCVQPEPVKQNKAKEAEAAASNKAEVKNANDAADTEAKKSAATAEKEIKDNKNIVKEEKEIQTEVKKQENFSIVLASYVTETNANAYIQSLSKNGFNEGRYVKTGKVSRVLYSGFATEKDAYAALADLRKQSKEFAEAWVLAL